MYISEACTIKFHRNLLFYFLMESRLNCFHLVDWSQQLLMLDPQLIG
jgi:hypothetical protein